MKYYKEAEYHAKGKDEYSFISHIGQDIEIIQVLSGGGYFLIKGQIFPIQAGAVYLINATEPHCSNPLNPDSYTRSKLILDSGYFFEITELFGLNAYFRSILEEDGGAFFPLPSQGSAAYQIDRLFQQAQEFFVKDSPLSTAKISTVMLRLLLQLLETAPAMAEVRGKTESILNRITSYINQNTNNLGSFSLDQMCRDLHISKSYVCHLFKQSTGMSVMQYINNLRISQAKKFLIGTDLSVQAVASALGYGNSTLFCKAFKKVTQCSPAKFRADVRSQLTAQEQP